MSAPRVLVAGIGNIFLGDDGFGVEVAQRLLARKLPAGVEVKDFGIRGIDLTYALLEGYELVIMVDAMPHGGKPGDLRVVRPTSSGAAGDGMMTHEMTPAKVLAAASAMGATIDNVLVVGCEPLEFGCDEDPKLGLSPPILAAIEKAAGMVEALLAEHLETSLA